MEEEDTEDYSPLLKAVRNGHLDEVRSLVSQGADVNQGKAEGWTPLMIAAKTGRVEVLMFLIDQGADISDEAFKREISRKKIPLEIGSKIYVEDRSGKLPMYDAEDEVVEQTILSRMKSPEEAHYYQESVNPERPKESKVSAEAVSEDFITPQGDPNLADKREQSEQNESQTKTTDREDHADDGEEDLIHLEKHGITVRISKYEIYSAKDISVEVIEDVPPELELKETEAIISVGLKMSPSDAIFDSPVRVTMPHCGVFTKPKDAEVFIYYRQSGNISGFLSHSVSHLSF
nr:ankyrin repeat, SAM and basic leucine zipper domain-containing protein 1-like [Lytechinus pictus]